MRKTRSAAGLVALGVILGLLLSGAWPKTPLAAVATDRLDSFAIATGHLDDEIEGVFFLDFLTGELKAAALNRQTGKFSALFSHPSVFPDLGIDAAKNAKLLMVTGLADVRRGSGRMQMGRSAIYIAEVGSGAVAAYGVPWNPSMSSTAKQVQQNLVLLDVIRFRQGALGASGS